MTPRRTLTTSRVTEPLSSRGGPFAVASVLRRCNGKDPVVRSVFKLVTRAGRTVIQMPVPHCGRRLDVGAGYQ